MGWCKGVDYKFQPRLYLGKCFKFAPQNVQFFPPICLLFSTDVCVYGATHISYLPQGSSVFNRLLCRVKNPGKVKALQCEVNLGQSSPLGGSWPASSVSFQWDFSLPSQHIYMDFYTTSIAFHTALYLTFRIWQCICRDCFYQYRAWFHSF